MAHEHDEPLSLTFSDGYTARLRPETVVSLYNARRLSGGGWSPPVDSLATNDELIGNGLAERRTVPVLTRRGEEARTIAVRLVPLGIAGEVPGRCTIDPALGEEEAARLSGALRAVAGRRFDDGRDRHDRFFRWSSTLVTVVVLALFGLGDSWADGLLWAAAAALVGLIGWTALFRIRRRTVARTPPTPIEAHEGRYVAPAMLDEWGSDLLLRAQRAVDAVPGPAAPDAAQEEWAIARDLAALAPARREDADPVPDAADRARVERRVLRLEEYAAGEGDPDAVGA